MTTAARALPKPPQIARMLSDLLGRAVEAEPGKPAGDLTTKGPSLVVTYAPRGDGEQIAAVCISDIPNAASLAAALTMVPASRVEESVRAKKLDEVLLENFREVCNVMITLLNQDSLPAVSLRELHLVPPTLPADLTGRIAKPSGRVDVEVAVDGYDGGKLTLLLL